MSIQPMPQTSMASQQFVPLSDGEPIRFPHSQQMITAPVKSEPPIVESVSALDEDLLMEASKLLVRLFPSMSIEHLHSFIMSQVHANVSAVDLLTHLLQLERDERKRNYIELESKLDRRTHPSPAGRSPASVSDKLPVMRSPNPSISPINGHLSPVLRNPIHFQNGIVENGRKSEMFMSQGQLLRESLGSRPTNGAPFMNGDGHHDQSASSPDPISLLQNLQINDIGSLGPNHDG